MEARNYRLRHDIMSPNIKSAESPQFVHISSWEKAFELPVLPWVKPFIPLLGLPQKLVEHTSNLVGLHQQLSDSHEKAFEAATEPVDVEAESQIVYNCARGALEELVRRTSHEIAVDFELWARRHFIMSEIQHTLWSWGLVLHRGYNFTQEKPSALNRHLPELADFLSQEKHDWLNAEIYRLAPEPTQEEVELGLDISPYGLSVEEVVSSEWTIESLKILASDLTQFELDEFMEWAHSLDRSTFPPESLKGDRYLRLPSPWLDLPTILAGSLE